MRQRALEREGEREQVRKKCDGNLVPSLWFPSLAVARIRSGGKRERNGIRRETFFYDMLCCSRFVSPRESRAYLSLSPVESSPRFPSFTLLLHTCCCCCCCCFGVGRVISLESGTRRHPLRECDVRGCRKDGLNSCSRSEKVSCRRSESYRSVRSLACLLPLRW